MESKKELFMYIGAGILIGAFIALVLFLNVRGGEQVGTFNSTFLTIIALIVGYYWGSSKGSSDKTKLLSSGLNDYPDALPLADAIARLQTLPPGVELIYFEYIDGSKVFGRVWLDGEGKPKKNPLE